jgi:hypothetical protein
MATALKERLKKRLEEEKNKRTAGDIFFQKPNTTVRIRILDMGEENEFIQEVTQFYLGSEIKGVLSPATFNEPCAISETYEELKNSKDDEERELAAKFSPRSRYLAYCAFYKDKDGKELDENLSPKFMLLSSGVYQKILELYLDENEWGDMTDPEEGYDLKIIRTGSGKTDTDYDCTPCKPTRSPRIFRKKVYDLVEEVRKIMPNYDKTKSLLEQYLGADPEDEKPTTGRRRRKKSDADSEDN